MTWQYDGKYSIDILTDVLKESNEKMDDLIAAVLTLAEITSIKGIPLNSVDNTFSQKREMLKDRK